MHLFRAISLLVAAAMHVQSIAPSADAAKSRLGVASSVSSYQNAVYYVNWAIYGRNYWPNQLPTSEISLVLYAFANMSPNGTVYNSDSWSDLQIGQNWNVSGNNAWGNVRDLYLLKKANRQMKVLLSIGGWTYSANFAAAASTDATRAEFAATAITLMKDWGFDGLDLDWEYPTSATEAAHFVLLLQAIRTGLDEYAAQHAPGYHFLLTVASSAGPSKYNVQDLSAMADIVDYMNLMGYDYAGSWDETSGHQANLYPCSKHPNATKFSTDAAVTDYLAAGVPAAKMLLGMPIYGRSFEATGGIGQPYTGVGAGSWEVGVWDYKALPRANATVLTDRGAGATYSYDKATGELVSYDTPAMVARKVAYLRAKGLGGSMFWEASADRNDDQSLLRASYEALGGAAMLDSTQNLLSYPDSQYANIASGTG